MFVIKRTFIILCFVFFTVLISSSFAIVKYGERCEFTAECNDHRLICANVTLSNDTIEQLCVCDRYHEWNGTSIGCVLKYTTEQILDMLKEKYDVAEEIESEANLIFYAQISAGLFVIAVGSVCSIVVIVYCLRMWRQDNELDDIVKKLNDQKLANKPKATTSRLPR